MDVSILGCLHVGRDGHSVVPSASKPRTVLGVLAVRAGRVVPTSTLLEELWGLHPPASAATTLQTYVLQLRSLMAELPGLTRGREEAKQILSHEFGGYRLNIGDGFVDVEEFERLADDGRAAMAVRDYAAASERLRDALRLWRGAPLVDVEPGPLLSAETTRLEDTRLRLFTDWAEADLRLGRHRWRVGDLAGLSARHPTNERVQALYMLALLGSGRRDRALEVYQQLRRTLRCELDTEPTPACQLVHHLVLDAPPDSGDELHWQHRVLDELAAEAAGRQGVTGPAEPYPSSRPRLRARL